MGVGRTDVATSGWKRGARSPTTRFVGRESELATLHALLEDVRLVTLMGLGGSGKTRLAIELMARAAHEFRHGCFYVDLAPLTESSLVTDVVAAALGVGEDPGRPRLDVLTEALEYQELVVILDNCEHVAAEAALLADRVLGSCPRIRMLAVSRVALGLQCEKRWRLPALKLGESVELFCDRASLVGQFHVTEANRSAIESICRRLEGLPLAIELAAARSRVLGPQQILVRLGGVLEARAASPRALPVRHRTLHAAMEWSCGQLRATDLHLLERLSVFPGDFDLAAAEAVGDGDVLEALTELVDQSLVVGLPDEMGAMRYRLPEPLRQCIRDGLVERREADDIARRHAEYYLEIARRANAHRLLGDLTTWFPQFLQDQHNFRKALDWAVTAHSPVAIHLAIALARTWTLCGAVSEGMVWMQRALALGPSDEHLGGRGLQSSGWMAWMSRDYKRSWGDWSASLEIMRHVGDRVGVGESLLGLAAATLALGDVGRASELAEEAMATQRSTSDAGGLAWACMLSGWTASLQGDHERGLSLFQEALVISRHECDSRATAWALSGLALMDLQRGQLRSARRKTMEMMGLVQGGVTLLVADSMWVWTCLLLAAAEGRDRSVLRLAGVLDGQRVRVDVSYAEGLRIPLRQAIDRAHDRLGVAAGQLLHEGAAVALDELAALAWEELAMPPATTLTPRELQVARLVRDGLTNAEIAARLGISRRTAETHVDHIREKLGLRSRSQIAAYLVEIDSP